MAVCNKLDRILASKFDVYLLFGCYVIVQFKIKVFFNFDMYIIIESFSRIIIIMFRNKSGVTL